MCRRWSLATTEHRLGTTDLQWSVESSVAGLKRVQPNFATSGADEAVRSASGARAAAVGGWMALPALGWGARDDLQPQPGDAVYPGAAGGERAGGESRRCGARV